MSFSYKPGDLVSVCPPPRERPSKDVIERTVVALRKAHPRFDTVDLASRATVDLKLTSSDPVTEAEAETALANEREAQRVLRITERQAARRPNRFYSTNWDAHA